MANIEMNVLKVGNSEFEIADAAARQDVSNLKEDLTAAQVELAKKANTDGYYEEMTVGNAEQLVSTVTNADDTPYNFRTTAGSADVGDRAYVDAVVGGTVCLNQLAPTYSKAGNGTVPFARGTAITKGHKVFMSYKRDSNTAASFLGIYANEAGTAMNFSLGLESGDALSGATIKNAPASGVSNGTGSNVDGNAWIYQQSEPTITDLMITDLTATFGTTIADYVYGLETATAGAGVAWLKANAPKIFDGGDIPFNAGTLQSVVGLSEKRNTGLNQWDEETELGAINHTTGEDTASTTALRSKNYTDIVGGSVYCFRQGANSIDFHVHWYDANKNFISYEEVYTGANINYKTVTAPSTARYMRFNLPNGYGTAYKNDICINLHWDGEKDGTYEPYTLHTYAFDPTVELRGVPKLKDGKMYFDGDRYLSDGTVQRRYGVVDLGTLTWTYQSASDRNFFRANLTVSSTISDVVCSKYAYGGLVYDSQMSSIGTGIYRARNSAFIYVKDTTYTDATVFKTAMSGVMLVYEVAEPTTETAEPYQQTQICDDFGTEEFISTSPVPVGHNTRYAPNLRAKLEMSPDSPDGDGVYVVQQSNGENEYIPLGSAPTIQNILDRLTALEGNTNEG